jgi:hypothetical protein
VHELASVTNARAEVVLPGAQLADAVSRVLDPPDPAFGAPRRLGGHRGSGRAASSFEAGGFVVVTGPMFGWKEHSVRGPPQRNEDRFYRYPKNRVVAIIADEAHLSAAFRELERVGVSMPDVNVLSGPDGARLLDRTGTGHGLRARLLRAFQRGAYEVTSLRVHEQALQAGQHVIYVPVRDRRQARKVADALRGAGGRYLLHFGSWTIGQLAA